MCKVFVRISTKTFGDIGRDRNHCSAYLVAERKLLLRRELRQKPIDLYDKLPRDLPYFEFLVALHLFTLHQAPQPHQAPSTKHPLFHLPFAGVLVAGEGLRASPHVGEEIEVVVEELPALLEVLPAGK